MNLGQTNRKAPLMQFRMSSLALAAAVFVSLALPKTALAATPGERPRTVASVAKATPATSSAASRVDSVRERGSVRVCAWPEYHGISLRNPRSGEWVGIDADLARELARDLGVKLEIVESSFPRLIDDLLGDRCDVAMFGVGMLPQRVDRLRFTQPYLQSDIFAVAARGSRVVRDWNDIDQPGVRVAVAAGTFMEPVMQMRLQKARMVVVRPPETREQELESGRVDVFMTDYPYSRRLLENTDWARLIRPPGPVYPLQYGYPVKPGDERWFQRMSAFVSAIKSDGRLEAAARRHGLSEIVVRR